MNTPAGLFGSTSEGGMRLEEWLGVMCAGCKHERVKDRKEGIGGGSGCDLVSRAICDPYTAEMPEWSPDATWPERFTELEAGNPWPVCIAWEARAKRSDAGMRRGPKVAGMDPLFELGDTA